MIREVLCPGNLLLCGEYAITRPGGCGVALAISPTLTLSISPAPAFSFTGLAGDRVLKGGGLVRAVLEVISKNFAIEKAETCFPYALSANSGGFYARDGRKLGYGSSAALTVSLVTACLGFLGALEGRDEAHTRAHIARLALDAHRLHQGGGSGYDVYASVYGGLGLFRQSDGAGPEWEALPAAGLPSPLALVRGAVSVQSKAAVQDFAAWCARDPALEARYVRVSNTAALALARAIREAVRGLPEGPGISAPLLPPFARALRAARGIGLYIGRANGRDPEPRGAAESLGSRLDRLRALGFIAKASGAGGELAFAFRASPPYTSSDLALEFDVEIACEGVRWR